MEEAIKFEAENYVEEKNDFFEDKDNFYTGAMILCITNNHNPFAMASPQSELVFYNDNRSVNMKEKRTDRQVYKVTIEDADTVDVRQLLEALSDFLSKQDLKGHVNLYKTISVVIEEHHFTDHSTDFYPLSME